MFRLLVILSVCFISLIFFGEVIAKNQPVIYLDFDESVSSFEKIEILYGDGSELEYVKGINGNALSLKKRCLSLSLDDLGKSGEGTISMWVKPDWDYYSRKKNGFESHTFLSMKWSNGGYFVLSDGWWESSGGQMYTYFIYDNKSFAHTHSRIIYKKNQWLNLTVTWSRVNKLISLYMDGRLVAKKKVIEMSKHHAERLIIGCDKGSNLFSSRWVNAVVDDLKIFDVALTESDVYKNLGISKSALNEIKSNYFKTAVVDSKYKQGVPENRVMFDSYPASWQTEEQARQTIKKLYKAGINIYVPCVWYGDGARFNSRVAPFAQYKGSGSPLKNLIKIAHEYGIEVHPWVTVVYRSKEFLSEYYDDGTPPKAFDVQKIEFRNFMVEFITDLVSRYDVDGINLDYIRTMGISKSDKSKKLFKFRYGKNLNDEIRDIDNSHSWNENVQDFVDEPINDIVSRVSTKIRKIKPGVIISVDGHPIPSFMGKSRQGRNEIEWLNKGLIDAVFYMNYKYNLDYMNVDLVMKDAVNPEKITVILGLFDKNEKAMLPRSADKVNNLVRFSRSKWGNGVAFYPMSMISEDVYKLLENNLFKGNVDTKWH